jgi:uncharacterized protein YukJ
MPLRNYGVLKGKAIDRRLGSGQAPHYQVLVVDDEQDYRIAVNVQSALDPSVLEFLIDDDFEHPITQGLSALPRGFRALEHRPGGLALDFIRANLFDPADMRLLPPAVPGPDNDLNETIDHYVQRAMASEDAVVYAFGQRWGPESQTDRYFGFRPGQGIHDIHMNQGNTGQFVRDDGVWQDGGLLFEFPAQGQWVGLFLKFQSQAWHTDDVAGHRIPAPSGGPPSDTATQPSAPQPPAPADSLPTRDRPDGLVRIVGALVNSVRSPEEETVTLLNASAQPVNLAGWALLDKMKNRQMLSGSLGPGETVRVRVSPPVQLSNQGGLITLLNDDGLRVSGVSYTRAQARNPGWTIVF